jgi:carbonic anhydrase/acetyltransferase-like protein (isoleucine patch superfamily)
VAPNATVVGDTHIGASSSIWYGAVIRGDVNFIRIGEFTNVQDNAVIHVSSQKYPTLIGNGVTIGHGAVVHACTVEDHVLIGMNSTILDGAVLEKCSMVAAGAVVGPGKRVASGWLWAGIPAKPVRELSLEEIAYLKRSAQKYAELAALFQ